jgi:hypothetical protein
LAMLKHRSVTITDRSQLMDRSQLEVHMQVAAISRIVHVYSLR